MAVSAPHASRAPKGKSGFHKISRKFTLFHAEILEDLVWDTKTLNFRVLRASDFTQFHAFSRFFTLFHAPGSPHAHRSPAADCAKSAFARTQAGSEPD